MDILIASPIYSPMEHTTHIKPSELVSPVPATETKNTKGFLDSLCIFVPVHDASQLKNPSRWTFTLIAVLWGTTSSLGSAMILPAVPQITDEFQITGTVVNLSVAFSFMAMAVAPLWWSTASELYGRRVIYLMSLFAFLVFNVLAAFSSSIGMFIAMRLLTGGAGASAGVVGPAIVADLWDVERRGSAMGIFWIGQDACPLVAPIISGALTQTLGWRSTQWALAVYGGLILLLMVVILPDTAPRRSTQTEKAKVNWVEEVQDTLSEIWRMFIQPFRFIQLLRFPAVVLIVAYTSFTYATYYSITVAVKRIFSQPPYSFSSAILGLMYIPLALGAIIAGFLGGRWVDYIMRREAQAAARYSPSGELIFRPQDRMRENAWGASVLAPAALLLFGWTTQKHVFWFVPCLALFLFSVGDNLIFNMGTTVLTEFFPQRSSDGMSMSSFVRNTLCCVAVIVTEPLINTIGASWLYTGFAIIGWAGGSSILWIMRRNADRWVKDLAESASGEVG
ncbi:major facilitator superfamily domain-containing protein [Aspergillus ambiguus]|uniref:major facilitator superfamily domain-containing protein n=1 Tax=Aspergillus ambiguus TaxID=176160 RepID=UPI003CCCC4B0